MLLMRGVDGVAVLDHGHLTYPLEEPLFVTGMRKVEHAHRVEGGPIVHVIRAEVEHRGDAYWNGFPLLTVSDALAERGRVDQTTTTR